MAMELLQALAGQALPLTVKDDAVVEQLRWLRAANFITAVISTAGAAQPFGTVLSITRRGREALRLEQAAAGSPNGAEAHAATASGRGWQAQAASAAGRSHPQRRQAA